MPSNTDALLLESVKTHRIRLSAAFLFGRMANRRTANDNVKRLIGSIVVAAVVCAVCVGVSFVVATLADQEAAREAARTSSSSAPAPSVPGRLSSLHDRNRAAA
jgi:hypothetical protein